MAPKKSPRLGFTGAPGGEPDSLQAPPISEGDRLRIHAAVEQLSYGPGDAKGPFIEDLVQAAILIRSFSLIGRAGALRARRKNLRDALRSGGSDTNARLTLSIANRMLVERMRTVNEEESYGDLIRTALDFLASSKRSRGDRPQDELDCGGLLISEAYERYCGQRASSTREGDFVELFTAITAVALREPRKDMHSVAERVLRGRIVEEGQGVRVLTPARFLEQS